MVDDVAGMDGHVSLIPAVAALVEKRLWVRHSGAVERC
jgi:hypothetical protein